jgi:hypothetical protein
LPHQVGEVAGLEEDVVRRKVEVDPDRDQGKQHRIGTKNIGWNFEFSDTGNRRYNFGFSQRR